MNNKILFTLVVASLSACGDSAKKGTKTEAAAPQVNVVGHPAVNLQGQYKLVSMSCNDRTITIPADILSSFRATIGDKDMSIHVDANDASSGMKCAIDMQSQIVELNNETSTLKSKAVKSVANCVDAQGNKLPEQNLTDPNTPAKVEDSHFTKVNDRQVEISSTLDQADSLTGCQQGQTMKTLLERI